MGKTLLSERREGIIILTLNRPAHYNALSFELVSALTRHLTYADRDKEAGAIIITGAGKAFCSGGDLDEIIALSEGTAGERRAYLTHFKEMISAIRGASLPVIAAVNGYCIGGGNEINLACDLTIASDQAKFGQAGPRVGSVPLMGGTQLLPLLVGEKKAKEMIYLCGTYNAGEARRMGLVNKVVPHDSLMDEALSWAVEILEKSPTTISIAKRAHNEWLDRLERSMEEGVDILTRFWGTEEAREGFRAFKEKRKPQFRKYIHKK
jgi:enoyl-CoA hydratase/carnithine racemase